MLYISDDYGKSMADLISKKPATQSNTRLVFSEAYGFDVSDFKPLILKLNQSKADAVICIGYGTQIGSAIRQLRENRYQGHILVPALIVNTESVLSSVGKSLESVIFNGFDYQNGDPELETFISSFKSRYKGPQSDIGVLAYVGMKIVLENFAISGAETIARLQAASPFKTILGDVAFKDRNFVYPMKLYTIESGSLKPFVPPPVKTGDSSGSRIPKKP